METRLYPSKTQTWGNQLLFLGCEEPTAATAGAGAKAIDSSLGRYVRRLCDGRPGPWGESSPRAIHGWKEK